jgi:hypothetical protein
MLQHLVFPKFAGGILTLLRSDAGFIAEVELQVSERVLGFTEQRGPTKIPNLYEPGSPYAQRPINRFFETTGVCWYFHHRPVSTESLAQCILEAVCAVCGTQERDLGVGTFHAKPSPVWATPCQGICIYDAVHGSLRLTRQLAERFSEVLGSAILVAQSLEPRDAALETNLELLQELVNHTTPAAISAAQPCAASKEDWVTVIAPGERAIHLHKAGSEEVEVVTHRYTPQGLLYQLVSPQPGVTWLVAASSVMPLHGATKLLQTHLTTGETRPIP